MIQQIRSLEEETGVEHMGVVMLAETTDELLEDMELFAKEVVPAFEDKRGQARHRKLAERDRLCSE